jgi:hypothetical protein
MRSSNRIGRALKLDRNQLIFELPRRNLKVVGSNPTPATTSEVVIGLPAAASVPGK